MAKPDSIPLEKIMDLFKYQGIVALDQAYEFLDRVYPPTTINGLMEKYTKPTQLHPNPYLWYGGIRKPWRDSEGGKPPKFFALLKAGEAEVFKSSNVKITASDFKVDKNTLHALALVDIALACHKNNLFCTVNRRVGISEEIDEETGYILKKYMRPDIQFQSPDDLERLHFVEFEQKHNTANSDVYGMVRARLTRWQELRTGADGEYYSPDFIVLFWLGKEGDNNTTLNIWSKAFFDFEQESQAKGEPKPAFKVYYREFSDFVNHPTFDLSDYILLDPKEDPEEMRIKKEREKYVLNEASKILTPLDEDYSNTELDAFAEKHQDLWIQLQNSSNRQKYFINQVVKLYEMSSSVERTGYALSSNPWYGIFLVRFWLEQYQLIELREDIIDGVALVYSSAQKGQQTGAWALESFVWDKLFRFFNFSSGGPLSFSATTLNINTKDRCYDLAPDARIETPWAGVCEDASTANHYKDAINWFISILLHYPKELGLEKKFRRVLKQSGTPKKKGKTKKRQGIEAL